MLMMMVPFHSKSGNGITSAWESILLMPGHLSDALDANGDGTISQDERDTVWPTGMRAMWLKLGHCEQKKYLL